MALESAGSVPTDRHSESTWKFMVLGNPIITVPIAQS